MLAYKLDLFSSALSIAGHHAGIPNKDTLESDCREIFADVEQKKQLASLTKELFTELELTNKNLKTLSVSINAVTALSTIND